MQNHFYHNASSAELAITLDSLKSEILEQWSKARVVDELLHDKNISPSLFTKHFGSRIVDFYVDVLKDKEQIGECPIVIVMLKFFIQNKLSLDNLYIFCSALKNSVTNTYLEFLQKQNEPVDLNKLKIIQIVFDLNFTGVIKEYLQYHSLSTDPFEEEAEKTDLSTEEDTHTPAYSFEAKNPQESTEYTLEEIQEFHELEEEIDYYINQMHASFNVGDALNLASRLTKYANTVILNPNFRAIANSIFELAHQFSNPNNFENIQTNQRAISTLLDCFIHDLNQWKDNLLTSKTENPHYHDQSIISNVQQIVMYTTPRVKEPENEAECIEFF